MLDAADPALARRDRRVEIPGVEVAPRLQIERERVRRRLVRPAVLLAPFGYNLHEAADHVLDQVIELLQEKPPPLQTLRVVPVLDQMTRRAQLSLFGSWPLMVFATRVLVRDQRQVAPAQRATASAATRPRGPSARNTMMQIGLREGGSASGERDLRLQASTWPPSAAVRPSVPSVGEDPGLSQRRLAGWAKVLGEALGLA